MVCSVPQSFAQNKATIETLCNWTKRCVYDPVTTSMKARNPKDLEMVNYLHFLDQAAHFQPQAIGNTPHAE